MPSVLITGSLGFIGSHLCNYFLRKGFDVTGWDVVDINDLNGTKISWKQEKINLLNVNDVQTRIVKLNPEIVLHCAGAADVGKSVADPNMDFERNVCITHNLMFAMHKAGLKNSRFVILSSAAVYGNPVSLPIKETAKLNPLSPYALHKVMCEDICKYFHSIDAIDTKIVRIFSAYGIGLRKQIFWDMSTKYKDTGKLCMFGTGNETRDYINIEDLINALYLIATKAPKSELIYNVASGDETTIRKVTEYFANSVNLDHSKISFNGAVKEGNPINWRADISKLIELGYKPSISLSDGIAQYAEWALKQ